jgi:DNA-binding MarR family transcriptional regulator
MIPGVFPSESGKKCSSYSCADPKSKRQNKKSLAKPGNQKAHFTQRQGQYLAFIHLYRRLHRQGPSELDMVQYFHVTPPAVHGMLAKLEQRGLVKREPRVPRSIRVTVRKREIPELEQVKGPSW